LILNLSYHVYQNKFRYASVSSSGGYYPNVWISNENGKLCIYIDDQVYERRFTVSVYCPDLASNPQYFRGWTLVDEALARN